MRVGRGEEEADRLTLRFAVFAVLIWLATWLRFSARCFARVGLICISVWSDIGMFAFEMRIEVLGMVVVEREVSSECVSVSSIWRALSMTMSLG